MGGSVLLTLLVAAVGGVLSSLLLTMLGTPRFQYRFWRYQRRTELQLEVVREVTRLAAEFLNGYLDDPKKYRPSNEFYQGVMRADASIRALFSTAAQERFARLQAMLGPDLGGKAPRDFILVRDGVLVTLYDEAVPMPAGWLRWLW
jgi:hypothetical protein